MSQERKSRKTPRRRPARTRAEEFRQFFHMAQDLFCVLRLGDAALLAVNPAFPRTLGYAPQDILGKPLIHFIHPDDQAQSRDEFEKARQGWTTLCFEIRLRRKDGTFLWLSWNAVPRPRLGIAYATARDVTERRNSGAAVLRAAMEWRRTFDSISDIIFILDNDSRITRLNRALSNRFNLQPQELLGRSCCGLLHEPGRFWPGCADKSALSQRKVLAAEVPDSKLGVPLWVTVSPVFDEANRLVGAVHVAQDISERKRLEGELRRHQQNLEARIQERTTELKESNMRLEQTAERLQEVSRAKSVFLAHMSHELRTPLNSIIGFSEVLCDETFGPLNERQKKYSVNVLESGRHLLALINDVLDMAKVEAGRIELEPSVFSLRALIETAVNLLGEAAAKKGVRIETNLPEDLGEVRADERKIKQVLFNLLSNALKFTPSPGRAGVRARRSGGEIEVEVWDTGTGVAPENQGKIFGAFMRVETPGSKSTEGVGLGLSLSKRLVELHGGSIRLESEGLGKGSTVRFTLPAWEGG
jgi:PAS domain S-box-containing protein